MRLRGPVVVAVLAFGAAVAQAFGRFAYGVLLPAIRDDLGISNTVAGTLGTVNVGAYLAGTIAVAVASSRVRLLPILRLGMTIATVGLVLSAVATGPVSLAVAMFLSGLGGAIVWIPTPAIAAAALGPERRNAAVALLGSGIGLGVVFAGQLSGYVRSNLGDESWRTAYVVMAAVGLCVTMLIFLVGHEQAAPSGGNSQFGGFTTLKRMPGWLPLTSAYTAFGLMYLLVLAYLSTRLEDDNGWTSGDASLAFTLVGLATVAGAPLFVSLTDRIGAGNSLATAFAVWIVLVLVILPGWWIPTLAASVGVGLVFTGVPSMLTLYVVANTSVEDYGPSFAAATLAFGVAQMISPQLGGLIADATGSFLPVFVLSAVISVVGVGVSLRLARTTAALTEPAAS